MKNKNFSKVNDTKIYMDETTYTETHTYVCKLKKTIKKNRKKNKKTITDK